MKTDSKKLLPEVLIIRLFLILLLVIFHSFLLYADGWTEPEGFKPITAYWWITKLSYACMLESFVFISGYLFAYQLIVLKRNYTFSQLILSKVKRLIVPGIIFSTLYIGLDLTDVTFHSDWKTVVRSILDGPGHMWFLPMLFWCFIGMYLLLKLSIPNVGKLALLVCLAIVSFFPIISSLELPLRLTSTMYYLLFFYLGYIVFKNQDALLTRYCSSKKLCLFVFLFLCLLISLTLLKGEVLEMVRGNIFESMVDSSIITLRRIAYATFGTMALWFFACYLTKIKHVIVSKFLIDVGALCFGVYLYQQFILKILYAKTSFPIIVGPVWLPVMGFLVTLVLSLLLAKLTSMTKIGRLLIG